MNKKVGIREAFHFEDEKKQVPSWNARNRTSSNRKRVIEVAELPIFSFLELLANTQSIFKKIHLSPKKCQKSCGWGFKGGWGYFHKTVHLTSCMRFLTRWAPSLVINGAILTINGLIHVSHWVIVELWTKHPSFQKTGDFGRTSPPFLESPNHAATNEAWEKAVRRFFSSCFWLADASLASIRRSGDPWGSWSWAVLGDLGWMGSPGKHPRKWRSMMIKRIWNMYLEHRKVPSF